MILRGQCCSAVLLAAALLAPSVLSETENLNSLRRLGDTTIMAAAAADALGKTGPIGTKDAPVDGRDGMPHEGPFVETNAERSRKKSKETGDEELAPATLKTTANKNIPISNDGVMDDAGRLGPAEGTRGTEGGVSGKYSSKLSDKKPDPPKESPPLPHSETEKMTEKMKDELRSVMDGGEERKVMVVRSAQTKLNPLANFHRNHLTCRRNLTISHYPRTLLLPKTRLLFLTPIHQVQNHNRKRRKVRLFSHCTHSSSPSL
jgi:hypothetical protein